MSDEKQCTCTGLHEGHLCVLRSKGLHAEIAALTDKPTVVCFSCGSEANCAENVCVPMALEEKR